MNQESEQRIVAMYFDNKDFEKNAKETIKTLGDLRDNLNLEDSVKGFEELDKAGKKLNLTNVKQTINGMKNSLGGFSSVLNKAFTVGTAPVRSLENFFHTFQSYVGKFVGFDLASKFVSSLEGALRQLTVAPVEAGWNMYFAKWACLAAIAFEGGSIISNLLRPYGIIVTPMSVIKWLLRKTPIGDTDEVLKEENIIEAREFEDKKWNTKKNMAEKIVKPEKEDGNEDGEARLQV